MILMIDHIEVISQDIQQLHRQDTESHIHNSDLLNLIPCELDLKSTPFCYTTILTYEIQLPPSGKKVGFNSLDDEYFTILYITDTIPNSPDGHQLPAQAKQNVYIIATNGEDSITAQGARDELNRNKNTHGKSKFKISICRRKSYQITDLEDICSIFDQVRPVVSNLEVNLPKKHLTPKNIAGGLKGPQRQF